MLINNLVYECDERYRKNKDSCQCEYCICNICVESNCSKCLDNIHYTNNETPQRTYDCVNMADYYYCVYSYRYASEVVYGLEHFTGLFKREKLNIMSVGCGPCTELAAIDYLHDIGKLSYTTLDFRGIDPLGDMWKYIWEDIESIYGKQVSFYQENVLNFVDLIVSKKWIPDLIIFQYVFSDMYKKYTEEEIIIFINKLAGFLNAQTHRPIYILANDINLGNAYDGGRDFFDILEQKINNPKIMCRYHFDNKYRSNHFHYGIEYEDNSIVFEIPEHIKEKYDPIDSCASAQVLIKKRIKKGEVE